MKTWEIRPAWWDKNWGWGDEPSFTVKAKTEKDAVNKAKAYPIPSHWPKGLVRIGVKK